MENNNITKDELHAMLETQAKATEQMVTIAGYLKTIADEQRKISDKITDGLKDSLCEAMKDKLEEQNKITTATCGDIKSKLDKIKDTTDFMRWVFGGVALVVAIATVIIQLTHHTAVIKP